MIFQTIFKSLANFFHNSDAVDRPMVSELRTAESAAIQAAYHATDIGELNFYRFNLDHNWINFTDAQMPVRVDRGVAANLIVPKANIKCKSAIAK